MKSYQYVKWERLRMDNNSLLAKLKGGLVVSCQALDEEPLHSPYIMQKMALAAKLGGAVGIRANGYEDITAIRSEVDLPVIGIVKRDYEDSEIYITATIKEVDEVVKAGSSVVAMDATDRLRPANQTLESFYREIRKAYPDLLLMADISTFDEGVNAARLGFDIVATTLCGYTDYTKHQALPNLDLVKALSEVMDVPVMGEGGYWTPEDIHKAISLGAFGCIVGSAITRPLEITKRFVNELPRLN
jgi:N-acylglucosamine-6-phosphate 2-epimerase